MKILLATLTALFFLTGCSNKKIIHNPIKNEILAYTQKAEIINQNNRVLIIATYANPIQKTKNNDEHFILSVTPKDTQIIQKSVKVNKDNNTTINTLKENDQSLANLGFNLPWAKHYKITTTQKNTDKLELDFQIKACETCQSKQVQINFQKVAKSLYWNR